MIVRRLINNAFVFLTFVGLTLLMTWPWVKSVRDYTPDAGDSYLNTWILWWDFHQTFRAPLHLFQANILYPYQYTLAFSEHNYGLALLFFPLYALGLRPLTVQGIAVLAGFAFSGFGSFRLVHTLVGSRRAAWIAGLAFAFVPFRFHHLPHVNYLFAGWMPLLLEALVLYTRQPTKRRAIWLGVAFYLNALTCIHWFLLTLIPLAVTLVSQVSRYSLWRNRRFWFYAGLAFTVAAIALVPFLLPYIRVKQLYGFERTAEDAQRFSAHLINWLMVDWQNKLWHGMGHVAGYQTELALFPGFFLPLLAISALRFWRSPNPLDNRVKRKLLVAMLEAMIIISVVVALLCIGYGEMQPKIFGVQLFRLTNPWWPLAIAAAAFIIRVMLFLPPLYSRLRLRFTRLPEAMEIGVIWTVFGFMGSFGMNFIFHRLLFFYVPIFRSIRVPARWAMICFVGLSLLAGAGAVELAKRVARTQALQNIAIVILAVILLCEQREAPLQLVHGAVDPDPMTLRLRDTPMRGGIVELPAGVGQADYLYMLRAADHAQSLVNGVSGFRPPIQQAIEEMSNGQPITPRFADLLEAIPVSYVVVHHATMPAENDKALRTFFNDGVAAGRFRLVGTFPEPNDDLYVVTKTESTSKPD